MENEEVQPQDAVSPETSPEETQVEATSDQDKVQAELAKYKAIAERKTKQLEKVQASLKEEEKKPEPIRQEADSKYELLEFKVEHPELKDHLDLVQTVAKGKGITLSEAAKDPLVAKILEANGERVSVINSNSKVATTRSEQILDKQKVIKEGTVEALAQYLNQE
jgi:predicted nuclease with TOPRIM domain